MQSYIDLHRHAAVRAELAANPGVAIRLMVAHAIEGSPLWSVRVEPQRSGNEAIQESVEGCASESRFDLRRRKVIAMLGLDEDEPTICNGFKSLRSGDTLSEIFLALVPLSDAQLFEVAAIVMGETLCAGTEVVETVGLHLGVDMGKVWQADEAFLDLIRDREILLAMVAEIAGEEVAKANEKEKGKALKAIIGDCLTGDNGRVKAAGWVPKWMAFPPAYYTERGGVGTVVRHGRIASLFEEEAEIALLEAAE
jgi:ParB family chromosome partitioning protein